LGVEGCEGARNAGGEVDDDGMSEARLDERKCWRRISHRRPEELLVVRSEAEDTLESNDDFFTGRGRGNVPLDVDEPRPSENGLWSSDRLGLETGDSVNAVPAKKIFLESFGGALLGSLLDADP